MPRTFSFSFGFECYFIQHGSKTRDLSLNGLVYKVSINRQTDRTDCVSNWENPDTEICDFESVITTNLLGNNFTHSKDTLTYLKTFYNRAVDREVLETNQMCYQHFLEIACHIILPPCESDTGLVIHPCKEACYDMIKMCKHDPHTEKIFGDFWEFDCDYLPSVRDDLL